MTFLAIALAVLLGASLALNIHQSRKLNSPEPVRPDHYEVTELLNDLTSPGVAIVELRRIAPANVMIRSPRDV